MKPKYSDKFSICEESGKRMIRDEKTATRIMRAVNQKQGRRVVQSVYICDSCNWWHLTKMKRSWYKKISLINCDNGENKECSPDEVSNRINELKNNKNENRN